MSFWASFRHDTYTGGEHYWIRFHNGTHELRKETYPNDEDNETVFTGSYESCLAKLQQIVEVNADYDLNL